MQICCNLHTIQDSNNYVQKHYANKYIYVAIHIKNVHTYVDTYT